MLSNMNVIRIIITILIFSFAIIPVYCDDFLIWDYTNDTFLERMKNNSAKDNAKIQEELDNAIKQGLDIDLIPVNLKDCIEIALENSSRLKIMRHQQKEAKWMYVNAISELLPDFYYRYQLQDLRGQFLVGDILPRIINANPVYSGFNISYPIIGNGSPLFTIASQKKLYRAAGHDYNYSKDELLLNTALRYYALLESKLGLEVLLANLRDRYEQQKLMKARYEIGVGTKYDVLRADAELAIAKKELVTQLNSLRLGQADLADIMGIDITIPLYPVETNARVHKLVDTKYNIEGLYDIALNLREDIKSKELNIRSLNLIKNRNYTMFAPYVTLSYEMGRAGTLQGGSLSSNYTLSLNAVWPIGEKLGMKTLTQKNADLEKLRAAKLELRVLKSNVKKAILNSFYNSKSALEKIDAAKKEVEAADEGLKFSLVGFEVGTNTFIDVLDSQSTKVQARRGYITSVIEYNRAQIQLLFDSGAITTKSLLNGYNEKSYLRKK